MKEHSMHDREPASSTDVHERIENDGAGSQDGGAPEVGRRALLRGVAVAAVATATLRETNAFAAEDKQYPATPPAGFTPFTAPGHIVKVTKADSLQANKRYPKEDDAKAMLTRALMELTGKSDLVEATKCFVHPQDVVCVKVNGIAEANMGTNKELVLPFLEAMIAAGVPPEKITVLEQYGSFLAGTRINAQNVPKGVKVSVHQNSDMGPEVKIHDTRQSTQFARVLMDATAVINFSLIKDHSIHGYTGLMKNMTHGCQKFPHYFHAKPAMTQIALLYNNDAIRTRVRLGITDGFKIMANGGPLWKSPKHVIPHESVYVTTDPVAMDTTGYDLVEKARKDFGLRTLKDEGREPGYIAKAADLKLGVGDRSAIQLKEVTL